MRVALIIPVYNHGDRVAEVVRRAGGLGWPIYVVNDGSTDTTAQVLADLPGIHVLTHEVNQGKGAALMTGFSAAAGQADWAVTLDADGQHDPSEAVQLLQAVPEGQRPLVLGVRQGMDHAHVPWTSRWGRRFSNFWVYLVGGVWVKDTQSGYRLYPLPETLELAPEAKRYQFELEIIVLAAMNGLPIRQVPISVFYQPPGQRISHWRPWLDFWRNAATFYRLVVRRLFRSRAGRGPVLDRPHQDRHQR